MVEGQGKPVLFCPSIELVGFSAGLNRPSDLLSMRTG